MPRAALLSSPIAGGFLIACLVLPVVARALLSGDGDCNGRLTDADLPAVTAQIFSEFDAPCPDADANRDGTVSAADLSALIHLLRPSGPLVSFLGVTSSDGHTVNPLGVLADGTPVYYRSSGFGFQVVVEAMPGTDGARVGSSVFDSGPGDPARRPDLQIQVNRPLGNGSSAVCDEFGVTAVEPPDFSVTQPVSNAINDLACRFRAITARRGSCTENLFGQVDFVSPQSTTQFCVLVARDFGFPLGDTLVSVRVRDERSTLGELRQLILRVGTGPMPPTFTPLPATWTPKFTATRTATRTPSRTRTRTRTRTPTNTRTRTDTRPPTVTATRTRTPTVTVTGTATSTRTRTWTPRVTFTGQPSPTRTHTPVKSPTGLVKTNTRTSTRTATATPTRTLAPTGTKTGLPGATSTRTRTRSPTVTPTVGEGVGPVIVFLGVLRPDDTLTEPVGIDPGGVPIYQRPFGFGFSLVVEAKRGLSNRSVGTSTFDDFGRPDFQIQVNRPLGNGSSIVCDALPPDAGGVPAINPPSFGDNQIISDRLNDLACRFVDGSGNTEGRLCSEGCVRFASGEFGCVFEETRAQFCGLVARTLEFLPGDTLVTVRVLDVDGNPGQAEQIIVRIEP